MGKLEIDVGDNERRLVEVSVRDVTPKKEEESGAFWPAVIAGALLGAAVGDFGGLIVGSIIGAAAGASADGKKKS